MTTFAAKAAPDDDKLRGGYYTPDPIARFVASWVGQAGSALLEPSCGDGAILRHLVPLGAPIGIELFPEEAEKAAHTGAEVVNDDFFSWFDQAKWGTYDGIAGNPPYIRFGSWREEYRAPAFDLMVQQGLKPTRLTNAWVPFVVASLVAVRPGGRVGLVLPAELLQVGYAAPLRAFLVDNCSEITVVSFRKLVFPGILQEVVLLLAVKGEGPAAVRAVEVPDSDHLDGLELSGAAVRAPLHATEKWTKYHLDPASIEAMRLARSDRRLRPLGSYAAVNVGVVTGRNSFFCMTETEEFERGLTSYTVPLVSRSAQLQSIEITADDLQAHGDAGHKTRLLAVGQDTELRHHARLRKYVQLGEAEGVHEGYKCRIRPVWWSVPSISVPDGFMLRQVSTTLRISANNSRATSTDTVHRVFVRDGVRMDQLATVSMNSITIAMSEVIGRSYGGGILELEPSECTELPVPDPSLVSEALIRKVDELLRAGRVSDAVDVVDREILIDLARFREDEIDLFRSAGEYLRQRRADRAAK